MPVREKGLFYSYLALFVLQQLTFMCISDVQAVSICLFYPNQRSTCHIINRLIVYIAAWNVQYASYISIRASVDALCRDDAGQVSRDLPKKAPNLARTTS